MITKVIIMSLVCFGAFKAIDTFLWKLFGFERSDLISGTAKWLQFVLSPVLFCIYCSASFWGSMAYFSFPDANLYEWIVAVIACCGLNLIIEDSIGTLR
jgi:hypothetical protein